MITTIPTQKAEARPRRLRDQFREWLVFHHYSPRTVICYIGWVHQFVVWAGKRDPRTMGAAEVNAFLSYLANSVRVTAKTQTQALCALVKFYECVGVPLGDIGKFEYASTPSRLPVVMSTGEVQRVLAAMPAGALRFMAQLLYGCGLRLMDCCRLRVKDIDWERGSILVRAGKGDKDRTVMLPQSVRDELKRHLDFNKSRFERDGGWVVHLPGALARKFPGYEREWRWQYVFAAKSLSTDPEDKRLKMHHIHENTLQKAVKTAVETVGLTKRATCHTFRHSFATHLIEAGVGIEDVKELLGHSRIDTTMIYLHVACPPEKRIASPLDRLEGGG